MTGLSMMANKISVVYGKRKKSEKTWGYHVTLIKSDVIKHGPHGSQIPAENR